MAKEPQLRLLNELRHVLDKMGDDLARLELLTAALAGFSRPVPDYEPRFHHLGRASLAEHELSRRRAR